MTLLDPRIASDFTTTEGYARPMTQDVSLQRPASPDGPWPPYAPPPPPRRGLGAVIIAAGLAVGLVGAALVMNRDDDARDTPASNAPTPSASAAVEDSATCKAWGDAWAVLRTIPDLPPGWDWDTPNIDTLIANRNAAIEKTLSLFEPKIADQPADVAEVAHTFVDERRETLQLYVDHTYTQAAGVAAGMAATTLSRLCDIDG